ncbi:MAG: hypothetical protein WC462_02870 [archaeon]
MNPLPIIFIHKGDSFYLKYALINAKKFNPDSRIILLGENITKYPDFIEYYPISKYNNSALAFRKIYKHMSIVPEEIERFCFERWFLLDEFLTKNRIKKCLTLDSDVLLYENVSEGIKKFNSFDFTLSNKSSGGFMFINNSKSLSDVVKYMYLSYSSKKLLFNLELDWKKLKAINGGGINDIKLFGKYFGLGRSRIGELDDIINDSTYDAGILIEQNFVMEGKIKKVVFENGIPYGYLKISLKKIRFCCLHLQGPAKFYMKCFSGGKIGLLDKSRIKLMMWLRDSFGGLLTPNLRDFAKSMIAKLGF